MINERKIRAMAQSICQLTKSNTLCMNCTEHSIFKQTYKIVLGCLQDCQIRTDRKIMLHCYRFSYLKKIYKGHPINNPKTGKATLFHSILFISILSHPLSLQTQPMLFFIPPKKKENIAYVVKQYSQSDCMNGIIREQKLQLAMQDIMHCIRMCNSSARGSNNKSTFLISVVDLTMQIKGPSMYINQLGFKKYNYQVIKL